MMVNAAVVKPQGTSMKRMSRSPAVMTSMNSMGDPAMAMMGPLIRGPNQAEIPETAKMGGRATAMPKKQTTSQLMPLLISGPVMMRNMTKRNRANRAVAAVGIPCCFSVKNINSEPTRMITEMISSLDMGPSFLYSSLNMSELMAMASFGLARM
ncbi:MAG: hypothetical protein A4E69_02554 [Syntrophus sp. PtaB.Bin138]|nr:MAG: hypothetical protein A4E69_02554 [Syntrophus sp. PtaB.Bin138]